MSDIATIGIAVDTSQVTTATAALERFAKAGADAQASVDRISKASADAFTKAKVSESFTAAASAGYGAHAAGIAGVSQSLDGFTKASVRASAATGAQTAALHGAAAAHKSHGAAAYGNRLQMMELAHVSRALFDEMASGGNILRGLAMEFGRLQIAVSSGEGGISGMLGRIGSFAMGLANPLTLAAGGVAAVAAASGLAFVEYEASQEKLERAMNGRGRYSGLTMDGANRLAASSAAAGGLSTRESEGLTATYLGGGLPKDLTDSLLGMTRDFARVTDQSTADGGKALASAFADPMRGLGELNKTFGFLDDRLKQQVDDLVRSGHLQEAQAVELAAVNRAMRDVNESAFSFSRSLNGVGNFLSNSFSNLGHGVANAFGYGSDTEKLERDRTRLAALEGGVAGPGVNTDEARNFLKSEIPRLEAAVSKSAIDAASREKEGQDIEKSGRAGDAIRTLLPEIMRGRNAADTVEVLRQVLASPSVMQHLDAGITPAMVGRAYANASVLESFTRPGARERTDYDMSMNRIKDYGIEDQGLNTARKAELDVLRQTGDVMRAATAAQSAYNLEIAKSNEAAEDRFRQAQLDSGLIGLSPYERAKQKIRNEFDGERGILERDSFDSTKAIDDKDIKADLSGGFKILTAAQDAVVGITGAGTRLVAALDGVAAKVAATAPAGAPEMLERNGSTRGSGAVGLPMFAAMQAFIDRGYSPAAAAGFVGGLSMESGTSLNPAADNGSHLGIAQWDRDRWARLSGALGPQLGTRQGQLNGVFMELGSNEPGAGRLLAGANTVAGGLAASDAYERPGDVEAARRHGEALSRGNALLAAYPGGPASALTVTPSVKPVLPIASTAESWDEKLKALKLADNDKSFMSADPNAFGTPLGEANRSLTAQIALQRVQAETFGQTTAVMQGATAAQQLMNKYIGEGVTPVGTLADRIRDLGARSGQAAQEQEDQARRQKQLMDFEDTTRNGLSSSVSGGLVAMAHGKSFGEAFRGGMANLGDSLINQGTKDIFGGLFGQQGKGVGTGLFGSMFGGGGTPGGFGSYGPQLPGAGGGIGSLLSNLFSALPHFAGGTSDFAGGPAVINENGPETVVLPQHSQVMTANQSSGLMGGRSGGQGHTFNFGDTHIHPVGGAQFTPDQLREISG